MGDKKTRKEFDSLEDALSAFTDALGPKLVCDLGDVSTHRPLNVFSTGCLALDIIIGKGGFPRGRSTEVWGQEGGGKSTLMYSTMAQLIKNGGKAVYIDMEHKVEDDYMYDCVRANGIAAGDVKDIFVVKPPSGTDALNIAKGLLGHCDLIVIDSIPALVTKAELSASDSEDQFYAATARLISQNIKQIVPLAGLTETALVGINQARASMQLQGSPYRQMGGHAWKHAASLRLWVRRAGAIIKGPDGEPFAINCKATVQKNAIGIPDLSAEFEVVFGLGVDPVSDLVKVAPVLGVMERNGGHHYYQWDKSEKVPTGEGGFYLNGEAAVVRMLRDNAPLHDQVRAEVITALKAKKETENIQEDVPTEL